MFTKVFDYDSELELLSHSQGQIQSQHVMRHNLFSKVATCNILSSKVGKLGRMVGA